MLGRLASIVAKQILSGHHIVRTTLVISSLEGSCMLLSNYSVPNAGDYSR